jgi:hypothetical protein
MRDYYKSLFSIECTHSFYIGEVCRDLAIAPTAECAVQLRRHRLLFKPQETGGIVIGEQRNIGTETSPVLKPQVAIAPDTIFTFQLQLKNPDFLTITTVDQSQIKPFSGFVFFNAPGTSESTDGTTRTVQVHNGALGSPLAFVGKVFRYAIVPGLDATTVAVHNAAEQKLLQINLLPHLSEARIDLSGFPEGIYHLRSLNASGVEVAHEAVFVSDAYRVSQLLGFLQIHYRDDMLQDAEKRLVFSLAFENRRIPWIYTIDVKDSDPGHPNTLNPDNIQLQSATSAFTKSQVARRVTFTSNQPIALQQESYQGIQLTHSIPSTNGTGTTTILMPHMPNPEPRHLVQEGTSNFRAELYLTIR